MHAQLYAVPFPPKIERGTLTKLRIFLKPRRAVATRILLYIDSVEEGEAEAVPDDGMVNSTDETVSDTVLSLDSALAHLVERVRTEPIEPSTQQGKVRLRRKKHIDFSIRTKRNYGPSLSLRRYGMTYVRD